MSVASPTVKRMESPDPRSQPACATRVDRVRRWFAEELRVGAWLDEHDLPVGQVSLGAAISLIAALYLTGWGEGFYAAVAYLVRGGHLHAIYNPRGDLTRELLDSAGSLGAVVLAALLAIRLGAGSWDPLKPTATRHRWRAELRAGAWAIFLTNISFYLGQATGTTGAYPLPHAGNARWLEIVSSVFAGPTEELALLVAPIVLLRAARVPWKWVWPVLVLIRLSFHIYYGPGVVFLVIWAGAMLFIYQRDRAIIGIVLAHSLFDLRTDPSMFGAAPAAQLISDTLMIAAAIVIAFDVHTWVRSEPRILHPTPAADSSPAP